ncbi:MAG: adenine deaminase, partial [bacterium]
MKGLTELIAAARGDAPCDIVLRNARIVNTCTREIIQGDVGIKGDRIAGIGRYEGLEEVDLDGRYVAPGFIEAHFHIESTLLRPSELA